MNCGNRYGPNQQNVEALAARLRSIAWLSAVGQALPVERAQSVDFKYFAANLEDQYAGWRNLLSAAESRVYRLAIDNGLLEPYSNANADFKIQSFWSEQSADQFWIGLDENYTATVELQFPDLLMYPHEIFELPDRLIRGAAGEKVLGQIAEPGFFGSLLPIFESGHCPVGWVGDWPNGLPLVW